MLRTMQDLFIKNNRVYLEIQKRGIVLDFKTEDPMVLLEPIFDRQLSKWGYPLDVTGKLNKQAFWFCIELLNSFGYSNIPYFSIYERLYPEEPKPLLGGSKPVGTKKRIIFLCGLQGTGKSTFVQNNLKDSLVFSQDSLWKEFQRENPDTPRFSRSYNKFIKESFNNFVDDNEFDIKVIDGVNLSRKARLKKLSRFGTEYSKEAVVLFENLPTCYNRRCMLDKSHESYVPPEAVYKSAFMLSLPSDEFDLVELYG